MAALWDLDGRVVGTVKKLVDVHGQVLTGSFGTNEERLEELVVIKYLRRVNGLHVTLSCC